MNISQVSFGADCRPICSTCGFFVHVTRRMPHAVHGTLYELQTFQCRTCKREIERSADREGNPHQNKMSAALVFERGAWHFRAD
jgi:hypothetical protein